MYLKSLVLKGFKSFADRSALTLEPGITAVVGPNGSGKSNISDAVLWVLGERNAKHLRGQAMQDVIFAGSSARKQVGMAEVELVLDNSDGTLPVEYAEVAITRRMYRSGESEYLINGSMARRMDVLDILHDTGLGTGTHSIISQGSLDSVLQSSPEERRALIEEAAGVLKHKQRKAKSERKLAGMDENLRRVRDITAEVQRQLGPLERKAKRARAYVELSGQLADLNLALAVDDLRALQRAWDEAEALEARLAAQAQQARAASREAEEAVERLQEQARRDSEDAGGLAKRQRRAAAALQRMEGVTLVLQEKRRAAEARQRQLEAAVSVDDARRAQARAEREQAELQLRQATTERRQADEQVARLTARQEINAQARREAEEAARQAEQARRADDEAREQARRDLASTQEALARGLAHEKLVESRDQELQLQLQRARDDAAEAACALDAVGQATREAAALEGKAHEAVEEAQRAREAARRALDAARDEVSVLMAQLKGLEELSRAASAENPALAWAIDHAEELDAGLVPLVEAVRAPERLEALVEGVLGEDVSALLVEGLDDAHAVARALDAHDEPGRVVLVPRDGAGEPSARKAAQTGLGRALVDELTYAPRDAAAVEGVLGDVVVCDSLEQALDVHARCPFPVRLVTRDGCMVFPNGAVAIGQAPAGEGEGALARARRAEEAREGLRQAQQTLDAAQARLAAAQAEHAAAQAESLRRAQVLAELRGKESAARSDAQRAEQKLAAVRREVDGVQRQRTQAAESVASARPQVEDLQQRIARLDRGLAEAAERLEGLQGELAPLREEAARLREELAAAKLSAATWSERQAFAERTVASRARELDDLDRQDAASREELARSQAAQARAAVLLETFNQLACGARRRLEALERDANDAQGASAGVHARLSEARQAQRQAHEALEEANARLAEARVQKGRLEVQVQAAVDAVVRDCEVPLDRALALPALEDRGDVEQQAFKLRRRIANMGTINPDAAQEYEQVKGRYDYLAAQLADLEGARKSLAKIVRVIDQRMKDDFVATYEQVDRNFQEIFSVLFPGGQARLSLVDPDDPENTGVEVSAQPRGKRITKMSLMSGGEKSLTALALLFAVYRTRSTPFYILDEVEAALDDVNLRRLISYLDKLRGETQLIMITHQRRTMETADVLFGVSMQADGVTKVVSQKLDRALQYAD